MTSQICVYIERMKYLSELKFTNLIVADSQDVSIIEMNTKKITLSLSRSNLRIIRTSLAEKSAQILQFIMKIFTP